MALAGFGCWVVYCYRYPVHGTIIVLSSLLTYCCRSVPMLILKRAHWLQQSLASGISYSVPEDPTSVCGNGVRSG